MKNVIIMVMTLSSCDLYLKILHKNYEMCNLSTNIRQKKSFELQCIRIRCPYIPRSDLCNNSQGPLFQRTYQAIIVIMVEIYCYIFENQ